MAKVTNNHYTPLALPNGFVIPAKGSADVADWDKMKSHGVVSKWVAAKILSVGGKPAAAEDEPEVVEEVQFTEEQSEVAEELDEKDTLIAQLAELGIEADKRSSVKKLQEKLDEALAK